MIQALEEEGFSIKAIAGTSAGAIVGAAYARGLSLPDIINIAEKITDLRIFTQRQSHDPSLLGLAGLEKELIHHFEDIDFNELHIPFGCTAVEINTAQEFIFTTGRVLDAVMATVAVPAIFPPKVIGDYTFVDGGILDPVPVALARFIAPNLPIVAVCLTPEPAAWAHMAPFINPPQNSLTKPIIDQFSRLRIGKAFNIFSRSYETSSRMLAELRMRIDQPDIILRPGVEDIGMIDTASPEFLVEKGIQAVQDSLPDLNRIFGINKRISRLFNRPTPPGKRIAENNRENKKE